MIEKKLIIFLIVQACIHYLSCMTEQIVIENDNAVFHFGKFWAMEEFHIVLFEW